MVFYTSDLHLGHANVIRFDKRPLTTKNSEASKVKVLETVLKGK